LKLQAKQIFMKHTELTKYS